MTVRVTWYRESEVVREDACASLLCAQALALAGIRQTVIEALTVRVWDERAVYFQIDRGHSDVPLAPERANFWPVSPT
jgi:hypothetical protein